jgi:hypothetical protein
VSAGLASVFPSLPRALRAGLGLWMGMVLGFGCGARGVVDEDALIDDVFSAGGGGGSGPTSGIGGGGTGGSGTGGSGTGGSGTGGSVAQEMLFEVTRLGRCEPGYLWSQRGSRPCNFRFVDRCYDDVDEVCACACPRDSNSSCALRGFLSDPDNPLMVTCQGL